MDKQRIRDHLRTLHSDAELQSWFDPLSFRVAETGILEVLFPHALFSRWFGKERQKRFERDILPVLDSISRVVFTKPGPARGASAVKTHTARADAVALFGENAQFSFDTFIYNKKNEFPVSMAREMAASAANPAYIPFVICGKGSCGKTHLLRAMAGTMASSLPAGGIYFGTVEEAENLYRENAALFKRKMLRHKAIFLDNGQNLSSYPELQQEFVFIAEKFKERKRPFVLTLDDSVDQSLVNPKLRARLESGLSVTVKKPDLDVRLRYANAQCVANRVHLKKELLLPIAQRFHNLTTIQGVILKASVYQRNTGKTLTATDMEKLLAGTDALSGKPANPKDIIIQVAEAFSVSPDDVTGDSRLAEATLARQTAMYLYRELLGAPYSSIGKYFNGKNHATVMYACKKIEKTCKSDKVMHKLVTLVRKKFLSRAG